MDVDLSRLPAGTSGWLALVNHALALGDLSEVDYLELKGALSFTQRPDRKHSAVVVSRAILGMANRMPDVAEKHLGGAGVVIVGIDSSQKLVGAESVDAAVLRDLIEPYVGEDGPKWDHQFIDHPDGLVLAVIVDPPQWGDRIFACRKDYADDRSKLAIRDGEVLVRVPGKTRPATSHDLEQLERRRARAPHTGAQVSVAYRGSFDRTSRASVRELVEELVDEVADELHGGIPAPTPRGPYDSLLTIQVPVWGSADRRSPERFRSDVEQWRDECRDATEAVVTEFLRHTLVHGTFVISNESDRYLENVRVEVAFPPQVMVLLGSDTDYCDHGGEFQIFQLLPDRPANYGDQNPYLPDYGSLLSVPRSVVPNLRPVNTGVEVKASPGGCVVSWHVGDLPPRASVTADEEFAVLTEENPDDHSHAATEASHLPMLEEISGVWKVTARGVDHVFQGEITLTCRQEPGEYQVWHRANTTTE